MNHVAVTSTRGRAMGGRDKKPLALTTREYKNVNRVFMRGIVFNEKLHPSV